MRFSIALCFTLTVYALSLADDAKQPGPQWSGTWSLLSRDDGSGPKPTDGFKFIITDKDITMLAPTA